MSETADPTAVEPGECLVWRRDLQALMKVSSETMRRWLRAGKLPEPDLNLSSHTVAWKRSTLEQAGIRLP